MKTRRIPVSELLDIEDAEWVDRTRRPFVEGGSAFVPVKEGYRSTETLAGRHPYRGRGYSMLGDVAVFHGRRPGPDEVRTLMEWKKPAGILWVKGSIGATRTPCTEILAGTVGEVRHRECGITYFFDPAAIMFSSGNRTEKERLRALIQPGERVADMFAGIGYFTLPAALSGAVVHAMEINPLAYSYLLKNIDENVVAHRVTPVLGDCRVCLAGTYDRILMGHFSSPDMLASALDHATTGTVLHVHTAGRAAGAISAVLDARGLDASVQTHRVKKLAPHMWHYVQDVTLE